MKNATVFATANREYKDTVFRMIFREKKALLSLYNAVNHRELLENCQALKEYMLYVERVRRYAGQPGLTLDTAVERAVDECIRENILADFLRKNRAEAVYMSIFEYDEEKEMAMMRRDEYNAGVEAGVKTGVEDTMKKTALRMLSADTYSLEEIAGISGLSVEAVRKLRAD